MPRFTGKFSRINVSLPADMVQYLRIRKNQEGVPISMQVRMAVERDVMDRTAAKHATPAGIDVLGNHPEMCELPTPEAGSGKRDYSIPPLVIDEWSPLRDFDQYEAKAAGWAPELITAALREIDRREMEPNRLPPTPGRQSANEFAAAAPVGSMLVDPSDGGYDVEVS